MTCEKFVLIFVLDSYEYIFTLLIARDRFDIRTL